MLKIVQNIVSKISIRVFSSVLNPVNFGMSRYFINKYPDYAGEVEPSPNTTVINTILSNYVETVTKGTLPSKNNVDGGLYVGITGYAYMYYHLANSLSTDPKQQKAYSMKAIEYLKRALNAASPKSRDSTSFLLGDLGTYTLAAAVYKKIGDETYKGFLDIIQSLHPTFLKPGFLKCGGDEYFVGRAGYIFGVLWLRSQIDEPVIQNKDLYKICDVIVSCGKATAKQLGSPCPLMYAYYGTQYLGAAHGLCSILQALISVPGYLEQNQTAAADIKSSIDFMLSIQTINGNWPCSMEELDQSQHKLVHWCHGAPGVVYLMAKAYLRFHDQKYLDSCIKAADLVWEKGLLKKGPGICHGVGGNGYVFLLLYRLTNDAKYLYRASKYAEFLTTPEFEKASTPDNPLSLYEGLAGTVCFLADLQTPEKAEFPLFQVFALN